jgi:PAT family beta-lactamase induction signal transducer AmpG
VPPEAKPFFTLSGFAAAVIDPFIVFFKRHGVIALLMLAMISLYRLPDFMMGPMAGPFYKDLGLSKDLVGSVRMFVGLPSALLGIAAGGLLIERFGQLKALMLGAVLQALAVASFSLLALIGTGLPLFCAVMAADSFCISIAGVALVTYLSTLTSFGYTATQYALLSSAYAYVGKTLKGFSGRIVDDLAQGHGRLEAYAIFFLGAGAIGIPALILCGVLGRVRPADAPLPMN